MGSSGEPHHRPLPLYRRPYYWLLFAVALTYVPVLGYLWQAGLPWQTVHPALNALLNATSTVFLLAGFVAIKQGRREFHWQSMVSAFAVSGLFLVSYLLRYAMSGTHRYAGHGTAKMVYLIILFSHMALAAMVLPLVLRLLWLARKRNYAGHKKLARWVWPAWLYVSVTGVVVYFMLYH